MNIEKEMSARLIIGLNIQKIRQIKGITINELAKKTEISVDYLLKIEKGIAKRISLYKHVYKISEGLNVSLAELCHGI